MVYRITVAVQGIRIEFGDTRVVAEQTAIVG